MDPKPEDDPRLPAWLNWLLNRPPFLWANRWSWAYSIGPTWRGREYPWWHPELGWQDSLFWNGIAFVRLSWPLGIFWSVRWSGATDRKAFMQCSLGWKLNGRFTCGVAPLAIPLAWLFLWILELVAHYTVGIDLELRPWCFVLLPTIFAIRFQSDASGAAGTLGPNLGQVVGWKRGPK